MELLTAGREAARLRRHQGHILTPCSSLADSGSEKGKLEMNSPAPPSPPCLGGLVTRRGPKGPDLPHPALWSLKPSPAPRAAPGAGLAVGWAASTEAAGLASAPFPDSSPFSLACLKRRKMPLTPDGSEPGEPELNHASESVVCAEQWEAETYLSPSPPTSFSSSPPFPSPPPPPRFLPLLANSQQIEAVSHMDTRVGCLGLNPGSATALGFPEKQNQEDVSWTQRKKIYYRTLAHVIQRLATPKLCGVS